MKLLRLIKRALRYILKGIPIQKIIAQVNVSQSRSILEGKHIIITGGSKGIGYAIAKKCINEGAVVLLCGRSLDSLKEAQKELGGPSKCKIIPFDISDVENVASFLDDCYKALDEKIDCLVNNAGVSFHEKDFRNVTLAGFEKQFNINYKGSYFLAQQFILQQEKRNAIRSTNILFISSERGSFHTDIPYGLTKAVINSLVGGLNNRLAVVGARINALAPGVTVSDMTGRTVDDLTYSPSPCGRVFLPEEMAEVAAFLLSDISYCISGEVINCDFGSHLKCI